MVKNPFNIYTKDDLKSLCNFIKEETSSLGYSIYSEEIQEVLNVKEFSEALKNCCFRTHHLSVYPFHVTPDYRVLLEPLDEMPLMINDTEYLTTLIAKWRLENSK